METTRRAVQDAMLRLASDARLRRAAENRTMSHEIVRRYVAGESISSAMDVAAWLEARGRRVSLTHLADEPQDVTRAEKRAKRLRKLIRRMADAGLTGGDRADVSIRLSSLGSALGVHGRVAAVDHLRELATLADEHGVTLTLEVEPVVPAEHTIDVFTELRRTHPTAGIALQACRRRTESDAAALAATGARVRLTKGSAAADDDTFDRRHEVDRAYVRTAQTLLEGPGAVCIATHDERLITIARTLAARLDREDVEYQLRYGVRPEKQAEIADQGGAMRVYVPFGEDWYPYLAQRVADSPREILALIRATAR